jgi:hypothetical protein
MYIQVLRNIRHRAGTRVSVIRLFGGSAARLFGCSAVRRFGDSAVRLFGCLAVRWFGGSVVRLIGCSVVRLFGDSAIRLFGCSAVRRFGGSAARRFGGSAVRLFGGSVGRLFGCSAVLSFGGSVVRLFGVWVQRVPKSRKMGSGGVENRGKSWSGGVLWALGGLVDDLVGIFGKAWQQDGAKWTKLGPSWQQVAQVGTKLAASCGQELPRWCQDGQLGHFVASFGTISDQFWELFGVSFCGWVGIAKSMKTTNSPSLLLDFRRSGG